MGALDQARIPLPPAGDWPFVPDVNMTMYAVPTQLVEKHLDVACNPLFLLQNMTCRAHLSSLVEFASFLNFVHKTLSSNDKCVLYILRREGCMEELQRCRMRLTDIKPPFVLMKTSQHVSYVLLEDAFPYGREDTRRGLTTELN
jgi:hypothetical protein